MWAMLTPPDADRGWQPEVHLVAGAAAPDTTVGGYGGGIGARLSIPVTSFNVSSRVPDWLSLGAGIELVRYVGGGSPFGPCVERTPAPAGTSVCTRVDAPASASGGYFLVPLVAAWSLGVAPSFSVFIEPGLGPYFSGDGPGITPLLAFGGRIRFGTVATGVFRLGWPISTFGVSF
jgi:hypothetical protein